MIAQSVFVTCALTQAIRHVFDLPSGAGTPAFAIMCLLATADPIIKTFFSVFNLRT
jgi:hypothetical protein